MKLAIVHDYLGQFGGAERVVGVLHEMFPEAPIYTSYYLPDRTFPIFRDARIITSFMQQLPDLSRRFRFYLPLYPAAFAQFDLKDYDVVLSSSSGWAHGVRTRYDALHICYCHTPARWLWDFQKYSERESFNTAIRIGLRAVVPLLRIRDRQISAHPDCYIANSHAVAERIRRCYGREARVIYPPVEVANFPLSSSGGNGYLLVSRLLGYKRIELVVEAFNRLGLPLRVVGDGPLRCSLEKCARPNITFLGAVDDVQLRTELVRCRALLFPGEEDFGIAPLEANACGRPAVAYAGGGALETVLDGCTGILFREPTVDALVEAIMKSTQTDFDPVYLREHARRFGKEVFEREIYRFIEQYTNYMRQDFRLANPEVA